LGKAAIGATATLQLLPLKKHCLEAAQFYDGFGAGWLGRIEVVISSWDSRQARGLQAGCHLALGSISIEMTTNKCNI